MAKISSIAGHRTAVARRDRKLRRAEMVKNAKSIGSREDVAGYVIIGIGKTGEAYAAWDTARAIPLWSLAGFVHGVMTAEVMSYHDGDDFEGEA